MTKGFATLAAIVALSAATTLAAQAARRSDPAQNQRENQVTAQLNRQQVQGNAIENGTEAYQGIVPEGQFGPNGTMMREQIAQPPSGSDDLSIIE